MTEVAHSPITIQRFAPGKEAVAYEPADFILTHRTGLFSWLIRAGQQLRYWGPRAKYAHWSHAALVVDAKGNLIEALGRGVIRSNISEYKNVEYHLVKLTTAIPPDRMHAVAFADYCVTAHARYGWLTIVSIASSFATGSTLSFGIDGEQICSGLVARCLERTGEIFDQDPSHLPPAGLAEHWKVQP
jgi:uncharacterized protein YycO